MTFQCPEGVKHGTDESKAYLAGEHAFRVEDMEVYVLQTPIVSVSPTKSKDGTPSKESR